MIMPVPSVVHHITRKNCHGKAEKITGLTHFIIAAFRLHLCVDKDGGPRHVSSGFGAPVCANEDGTYRKLLTFDYIGHFSRHILPGAKRIGFSRCNDLVDVTAAKNTDGSIAVVLLNRGEKDTSYALRMDGKIIRVAIPAKTISTVLL